MPRRKLERNLEEKERLKQRREKKADNQRQRRQAMKAKNNNSSLQNKINQGYNVINLASVSEIHNNRATTHAISLHQKHTEYQYQYRLRKKNSHS